MENLLPRRGRFGAVGTGWAALRTRMSSRCASSSGARVSRTRGFESTLIVLSVLQVHLDVRANVFNVGFQSGALYAWKQLIVDHREQLLVLFHLSIDILAIKIAGGRALETVQYVGCVLVKLRFYGAVSTLNSELGLLLFCGLMLREHHVGELLNFGAFRASPCNLCLFDFAGVGRVGNPRYLRVTQ